MMMTTDTMMMMTPKEYKELQRGATSGTASRKPLIKRKYQESALQIACVKWFKLQYPELCYKYFNSDGVLKTGCLLVKNANEGKKSDTGRMIGFNEGINPGTADMSLKVANKEYGGLEIELKVNRNKQSEAQKAYEQAVTKSGYKYVVCYTLQSFMNEVNNYLKIK